MGAKHIYMRYNDSGANEIINALRNITIKYCDTFMTHMRIHAAYELQIKQP